MYYGNSYKIRISKHHYTILNICISHFLLLLCRICQTMFASVARSIATVEPFTVVQPVATIVHTYVYKLLIFNRTFYYCL